jgi:hypothetical protein
VSLAASNAALSAIRKIIAEPDNGWAHSIELSGVILMHCFHGAKVADPFDCVLRMYGKAGSKVSEKTLIFHSIAADFLRSAKKGRKPLAVCGLS